MDLLQSISTNDTGLKKEGIRVIVAALEKMGKTTLGCSAPSPLLIPMEKGYGGIKVTKTEEPKTFAEVTALLDSVIKYGAAGRFPYKTLVFDSATALEKLIHQEVLRLDPQYVEGNAKAVTMESALGGFGKAYTYANERFAVFLNKCDQVSQLGINIVLTCHVFSSQVLDPINGEYNSWDLLLHSPKNAKTYGKREMATQWADVIGFLHEPIFVVKGDSMSQAVSKGNATRLIGLSRTPAYVAGNRYGVTGEFPIQKEQSWNYLADAIHKACGLDYFAR